LRLNEAISFCWVEPFNGTSSHSTLQNCLVQIAERSNVALCERAVVDVAPFAGVFPVYSTVLLLS
jgi:hypothetical protein